MTEGGNSKRYDLEGRSDDAMASGFGALAVSNFDFVSDFELRVVLRISNSAQFAAHPRR